MSDGNSILNLKRVSRYTTGVYGILEHEGEPFAVTAERQTAIIPAGEYRCTKTFYYNGGYDTYEITNVPNRTRILLHKGNWPEDSLGCVLIGESFGILKGRTAILDSKGGFEEFLARVKGAEQFTLVIVDKT